eukprot:768650-Hanusia_phi.AAC.14
MRGEGDEVSVKEGERRSGVEEESRKERRKCFQVPACSPSALQSLSACFWPLTKSVKLSDRRQEVESWGSENATCRKGKETLTGVACDWSAISKKKETCGDPVFLSNVSRDCNQDIKATRWICLH